MAEPRVRELLEYLNDIGWDAVYLPHGMGSGAPEALQPRPGPAREEESPRERARERPTKVDAPASKGLETPEPESSTATGQETAPTAAPGKLEELAAIAATCTRCRLSEGRHTVVFGSGNPDADLMFIGEGPGAEEDRQGLPFVGLAGQLLTRIIQAIELTREEVYIANVVKCRPPGNRDPRPDEVAACRGYLEGQIRLVRPRVIVALGRVAAQTLLGSEEPVGRMRGRWHEVLGVPVRVTYHPAAILRNAGYKRPTWEDMQVVRDRLRG